LIMLRNGLRTVCRSATRNTFRAGFSSFNAISYSHHTPRPNLIRISQRYVTQTPGSGINFGIPLHDNIDPSFQTITEGVPGTKDYKLFILQSTPGFNDIREVSPFFCITLASIENPEHLHMVCEIPKGTVDKMELDVDDPRHPIVQDVKNGKLRKLKHGPMLANYGFLPQTYEDPSHTWESTGYPGDGDPLDVIDLGSRVTQCGEVIKIKPLGCLGLIDQNETDWKIIGINVKDDIAPLLNDISDVEDQIPGILDNIKEWFRVYKVAEGKSENKFSHDGKYLNKSQALQIIKITHKSFKNILPTLFDQRIRELKDAPQRSDEDELITFSDPKNPRKRDLKDPYSGF